DRAIWFASHGFACLVLDTLEFGEVAGIHHGTHDLNMWHWLSLGYTPAGVEVWNAIRALDYLATRPEVDKQRIGLTGISGGGAMTWYTAAVDERIGAAAPVCSTFTFGSKATRRRCPKRPTVRRRRPRKTWLAWPSSPRTAPTIKSRTSSTLKRRSGIRLRGPGGNDAART